MIDFFKHNDGYISFDEDHIYLTNSSDWKEISKLTEKNDYVVDNALKRTGRIKNAAIAFLIFFTCIIFLFNDIETGIVLTIALAAITYANTNYFKPRYHYKIPFSKIDSIANSRKMLMRKICISRHQAFGKMPKARRKRKNQDVT